MVLTRKQLLEALKDVSRLIAEQPHWQRNLLDEAGKSTCDKPRQISQPCPDWTGWKREILDKQDFVPGIRVITYRGELGTIVKPAEGTIYDLWVDIDFVFRGKPRKSREMYRFSELQKISENL